MGTRLVLLLAALVTLSVAQVRVEELTILSADRVIDISSQVVQVTHKIKLENTNAAGGAKYFLFMVEPELKSRLAFFGAATSGGKNVLKATPVQSPDTKDALTYKVELPSELAKGKSVEVEVETVFTQHLTPFPSEITQKEKQLVKFIGSHYVYSPYKVNKQNTKVALSSRNIESFSKLKPFSQSDNTISFGPYENVAPFSQSELIVHYENNSPFLTITRLERLIEVSHWGNIAVEEKIEIVHTGAKLKGSFSRFDYQREPNSGVNSIKAFKTILPAAAKDVYYRDDIGNISTSNMWVKHDSVELTLRPRFPLFGGWKTRYVLGYNVPSYEYLFADGSKYALRMRLLDHVFDSMVVDELSVKIILPEGASNILFTPPYPVKELPRSLHFTYLDIIGRPVITVASKNLVENHIQDFTLVYKFPKVYMLREPLLVIAAFLVLFITVIIYVRLDFSISSKPTQGSSVNTSIVENVLRKHGKRATMYENFDSQLNKLKNNKDVAAFQNALKNFQSEHKNETQAINDVVSRHKSEAPQLVETITELQRLDRGYWEIYITFSQAVEKYAGNKMSRTQFGESENQFNNKRAELTEKINQIVKNL